MSDNWPREKKYEEGDDHVVDDDPNQRAKSGMHAHPIPFPRKRLMNL